MNIPPKYEDVVARLEAERELHKIATETLGQFADENQKLHADLAALREELERAKSRYDREVLGLNNEGDPIGGDPAGGYKNDLANANAAFDELAACVGFSSARLDQTGDSPIDCANQLQQRLTVAERRLIEAHSREVLLQDMVTVAEQRADEMESAAREMLRIAGIENQGSNAYNRAIINLHNALNPVETPYEYSGEDDFGHRERIDAALKPAAEGEGS